MGIISITLKDTSNDTVASEFACKNYTNMINLARSWGVIEDRVEELVQDVVLAIVTDEKSGSGYEYNRINAGGKNISVPAYVYGKLKGYSKNKKYRLNAIVSGGTIAICATPDGSDSDDYSSSRMSAVQEAFINAKEYADIESIEDAESIEEYLRYCCDFEDEIGFSIKSLFTNFDRLIKLNGLDNKIFDGLKRVMRNNEDVSEAFVEAINFRRTNLDKFNAIVARL